MAVFCFYISIGLLKGDLVEEKHGIRLKGALSETISGGIHRIAITGGKPPAQYRNGERCKKCHAFLSIYTRYNVCNRCIDGKILEIQRKEGLPPRSRMNLIEFAVKLLRGKERRPVKRRA
jgi:hypothetical protein